MNKTHFSISGNIQYIVILILKAKTKLENRANGVDPSLNFCPSSDSLDVLGVTGKAKTPPFIIVSLIERNRK